MRCETIYNNLIQKRQLELPEGYSEEHHIIPRSLGGDNSKDNLVRLTAREHYLAHYLLMKIQVPKSDEYYSMVKAFLMMQVQHESGLRYIPEGFVIGQNLIWKSCPVCGTYYTKNRVTCSDKCANIKMRRFGEDIASSKLTRSVVESIRKEVLVKE